ncbi:sucrose-phosphate synthase [Novimethylophilus kurashikiensis]|uniref:sucrose-phosphate synthase n=1 Tax=Novimethylophilus kurashikiensis TaxID=1825523 RepID=A0A2R5F7H6_9PROT|nr:HAD-IIB family hydrolase [Novimethylophilus kurashikiensis]GBG13498.1 sucrose-phosphate synthase [Novimethylophilus kurashikiensis]
MEVVIRQHTQSEQPLYILMISVHGLIRSSELELGRDADTGGQTKYVVEVARALARHRQVDKVDLVTRLVDDPAISPDYTTAEEPLAEGARLVRLACGPRRYIRKEMLWPHLDQMVDKCLHFIRQQGRLPDLIHSHYADAAYVGQQLSLLLGIPLVHTGHSLGRSKRERLLASGRRPSAIERQFNLTRRITVEEDVLKHASLIITSTRQEIDEQYGMYLNHDARRCVVIPPGIDTSRFSPPHRRRLNHDVRQKVGKFLAEPLKPMVLAISRPSERKNLEGLLAAYGNDTALKDKANLVVVAGVREDIRQMEEAQRSIMVDLLLDIDRHDIWGKVAIPKHIGQEDIPGLYQIAARSRGVFVNPALTEPFGLTLIEAAASGLPFIAPDDGGPRDIVANCRSGLLANTLDTQDIADKLKQALADRQQWRVWSNNGIQGVKRHYSWEAHVNRYVKTVRTLLHREKKRVRRHHALAFDVGDSPMPLVQRVLISDIDNTLIGDKASLAELIAWLRANAGRLGFGVATGRSLEKTLKVLKAWRIPIPDVLITAVGTEIYYGRKLIPDTAWLNHIRHLWRREALAEALSRIPGLALQPPEDQREFKLSYIVAPEQMPPLRDLDRYLHQHKLDAQLIYSHQKFLDVLPIRASKGHAIRYLAYKWGLPLKNFLIAGDSGNDTEMLVGDTLAVVVGNHSPELEPLRGLEQVYFAQGHCAAGILEGLEHYGFVATGDAKDRPSTE